jgi:hypothetical protein
VIPDPYFGLSSRSDLSLRESLPNRFGVDHDAYWKYMSEAGYLVLGTGFRSPSTDAEEFVKSNAVLVYTVGKNDGIGYFARIYRVNKLGCGPHGNPERP